MDLPREMKGQMNSGPAPIVLWDELQASGLENGAPLAFPDKLRSPSRGDYSTFPTLAPGSNQDPDNRKIG